MQAHKIFRKLFSSDSILLHYEKKIINSTTIGLDRVTPTKFAENKNAIIEAISTQALSGHYKFTRYRKLLISKGENKFPRVICIPTIKDKLVLSILNSALCKIFCNTSISLLPQSIIHHIYKEIEEGKYDSFIKIDIKTFYSTINHDLLLRKIKQKIRKPEFLKLITDAIKTPALEVPVKKRRTQKLERNEGIPEGISISNILANIYLTDIDNKYSSFENFAYHRYVDDILILCSSADLGFIQSSIKKDLEALKLTTNDKEDFGPLKKGFEYLGYRFTPPIISVRESSILNFENSLEHIFSSYKYAQNPSLKLLEWKLNLKITGCIMDKNKYGWLFYFSQINNLELISHLDNLIMRFINRFHIPIDAIRLKKFKRTYYEIKYRLHSSIYIPNFDSYTIEDIRNVLENIYERDLRSLSEHQIIIQFKKIMSNETKELEKDVQFFS